MAAFFFFPSQHLHPQQEGVLVLTLVIGLQPSTLTAKRRICLKYYDKGGVMYFDDEMVRTLCSLLEEEQKISLVALNWAAQTHFSRRSKVSRKKIIGTGNRFKPKCFVC